MGFYRGPNIVTDGLVFAMDAGSERSYPGTGTTTSNIINNASGTLTNGVGYITSNGGAFDFDGVDQYIAFPDDTNLNSQTITMETWSKLDSSTTQNGFLFEKGAVNTQYAHFFEGTHLRFRTMTLSTQDLAISSALYLSVGIWQHIVCTFGAGTKIIYINGVNVTQQTGLTGTLPTNTSGLFLGAYGGGGDYHLDGEIAVSRVYNTALTAAEVLQNYNAQKSRFGL